MGRSALLQIDSLAAYRGSHRLSYLMPALLWPEPAVLALPSKILETVLLQDIPNLQQGLPVIKSVQMGDRWPHEDFRGLLVTSAEDWLGDRLHPLLYPATEQRFPAGIPTLIEGAGDLERWIRDYLTVAVSASDWESLMLAYPSQRALIRDLRVRITHAVFQHPANPYGCHLIDGAEQALLHELYDAVKAYGDEGQMPERWRRFWQQFSQRERLAWSRLDRETGRMELCCGPTDIQAQLAPVWTQQPVVLIGAALDASAKAERYRDRLGLGEMTCLRFCPDQRNDLVQLYLPDRLPMPNTSHFKSAALQEIRSLLGARDALESEASPTVILVGDVPLKAQLATILAAEFGSRVQVETAVGPRGILVAGWEYWRSHQAEVATPGLLVITTLPIPSLENPLVAGRVATYKRRHQDWFKAYLLPEALGALQQAVAPMRAHRGVVALLDNRVSYRSYGRQILAALSPAARSSYLHEDWFHLAASALSTEGGDRY